MEHKPNNPIYDSRTGKVICYHSRSCAVVGIVYAKIPETKDTKEYNAVDFLISRRGKAKRDKSESDSNISVNSKNAEKLGITCGYLDWGESLEEAVCREIYEETGYKIPETSVPKLWKVISDPTKDALQNVVFRFLIEVPYEHLLQEYKNGNINEFTSLRGGEVCEISEIYLFKVSENLSSVLDLSENWAFNHNEVLKEAYKEIFKK